MFKEVMEEAGCVCLRQGQGNLLQLRVLVDGLGDDLLYDWRSEVRMWRI